METRKMLTIPRLRSGWRAILVLALGLILSWPEVSKAAPLGTAFTYQGHLYDASYAANGLYDFAFKLYDADVEGSKVGTDVNVADVEVIDAYFTVELDFGSGAFDGNARWLEIGIRPGDLDDPNAYTVLSPRQEITTAPYAIRALSGGELLWQVNGSDIYYNNGNIGIGTMSPEKKLDIAGEGYTGLGIGLTNNSPGGTSWDIDNDGGIFKIVEHAGCGPDFLNNTRIAVVGNCIGSPYGGNVGIGTISPAAKLDVAGDISVTSDYKIAGNTVLSVTGTENTLVGVGAGANNTNIRNTFLGYQAGYNSTTGSYNTFSGCRAGYSTKGFSNTFSGYAAGYSNTTGYLNTFSGDDAGYSNTIGYENTFSGAAAGVSNTTGNANTFLGSVAGCDNTTGSYNTFSGRGAGYLNTTGSTNTFLGYFAGYNNTTGSGNVFIGPHAGSSETGSNKLCIANSDSNNLICGDFSSKYVGINTTTPARNLHVKDVMRLEPRGAAPSSPSEGDMYMDSTDHKLKVYDGTAWQVCW